jgi:AhpD family alkylhydroperoxidase
MSEITVVDRPLCCSSGVCGPDPDPELVRVADDLEWLESQGVAVARINPSADPEAFLAQSALMPVFESQGNACLPALLADGRVVSTGRYPARPELARLAGITLSDDAALAPRVRELVAIGAAIAGNCEPCFRFHFAEARRLGVSYEEMAEAVSVAQAVKDAPAQAMLTLADRYLTRQPDTAAPGLASGCDCAVADQPASGTDASAPSPGCCC